VKKAVVLLSGGLDSTTALFWARTQGYAVEALSVHYGQRHQRELRAARRVAGLAKAPLHELRVSLPWLAEASSLVDKKKKLPDLPLAKIGSGGVPSTYVPGRNTIFLALAASLADARGAQAIVIGANALDYSGYPDCRPEYLRAFEKAARRGTRVGTLKILAPLLRLSKKQIVELGRRVGAPLHETWSCYAGGARPCGRCDSCKLRMKGFTAAGFADPAV
jgi:7-cyano-7-deazaguanine synthase